MRRVVAAACGLLVGAAIVAPANGAVRVSPSALLKKQSAALYRANIPVLLPTSIRLVDTFRIPTTEGDARGTATRCGWWDHVPATAVGPARS